MSNNREINPWLEQRRTTGSSYDERFFELERSGFDIHGEADLVEELLTQKELGTTSTRQSQIESNQEIALSTPRWKVLDAGCGTGRVAIELAKRGMEVVGIDIDPSMLDQAKLKAPSMPWILADISDTNLHSLLLSRVNDGQKPISKSVVKSTTNSAVVTSGKLFDAVVLAGNVMIFVVPGSQGLVLKNLSKLLKSGGILISGFSLTRGNLDPQEYVELASKAGLKLIERWSTWDHKPFTNKSDYVVSYFQIS